MTLPRVVDKAASNSRDNNLANNSSGTQMTAPRNALLRVERTRSRTIGRNRTRVDSGEHRKVPTYSPGTLVSGLLNSISKFIVEEKHGKRRLERLVH